MGSEKIPDHHSSPASSSTHQVSDMSVSEQREKHQKELQSLTLLTQPLKTSKFFLLASVQYVKRLIIYLLGKGGWLMLFSVLAVASGVLIMTIGGPHEKHIEELSEYLRFGLWWLALGVASSIGLGSGLHTFVLYLGPHIAFFTIKAMQCGRVDLKTAPYDTIQLERGPSWLDKECSEFGPPLFESLHGLRVPLSSILPQVQLEAILWGVGTAIGELPPYFISRAASLSGSKVEAMGEFDNSSAEGHEPSCMNRIKRWLVSHSQHLNFFTILVLASVPNPLFDLAGILCGQFGVPFWEFFLGTLLGKAIVKTHIQTVFIISVCNHQLLEWIENKLVGFLAQIPGVASILPGMIANLHALKAKYLEPAPPVSSNAKAKKWGFSFALIWNSIVWLMLLNFSIKIVNATAQRYLEKQQEAELAALTKNSSSSKLD